jgi:glycosyltransferase involved in cell wall biosynthesis
MLLDKGLRELKVVSELLKNEYYNKITFILAGMVDLDNKSGIDIQYLKQWQDGIYVKWIGHVIDMRPLYQESDIVILPSYREGLPKSLAEACSFGRPIITTDAIGCRECVDDGINGVLVPVKSTKELANAIIKLIDNKNEMRRMGKMGRIKAEKEFNLHNIVEEHMIIYSKTS